MTRAGTDEASKFLRTVSRSSRHAALRAASVAEAVECNAPAPCLEPRHVASVAK